MTLIQQVQWELTADYLGHPYYVSGNAIAHALGADLESGVREQLHASHGMFVPGQFGRFPATHSRSGVRPYLGSALPDIERYEDLFLFRRPDQPWLLDSRPRDVLNTHDVRVQGGNLGLANETIMGRPAEARKQRQTTTWYVNAYLHADDDAVLPLDDDVLDGLQFGGKRNYGYGTTRLEATRTVDLDSLSYAGIETSDAFVVELLTPFVLRSTYPGTNDVDVPWWWRPDTESRLRTRRERLVDGGDAYELATVDHGTVVGYEGDRPIETAKAGITRIGSHSKYGFGEFRILPTASLDEAPEHPSVPSVESIVLD